MKSEKEFLYTYIHIYVYIYIYKMKHVAVHLKLMQFCMPTII